MLSKGPLLGEYTVVYSSNGTLLRNKKESGTDTCSIMEESQKHYDEQKRSGTKEFIPYDSIYRKF